MRIFSFASAVLLAALLVSMTDARPAAATPNYARETGVSCFSCHSQPAKKLGALNPVIEPDSGSFVYSSSAGKPFNAGLSIHKSSGAGAISAVTADPAAERQTTVSEDNAGLAGVSGYFNTENFSASLSFLKRGAEQNLENFVNESGLSVRYRLAFTPKVGPLDMAVGVFGSAEGADGLRNFTYKGPSSLVKPKSFGLDANVKSQIGFVTLDLKAMYMNAENGESYKSPTGTLSDVKDSFGAAARVGINKKFGLSAAYRTYKGKSGEEDGAEDVASIGAWVNFSKNTMLESQYTAFGSDRNFLTDDGVFTLLFIAGF